MINISREYNVFSVLIESCSEIKLKFQWRTNHATRIGGSSERRQHGYLRRKEAWSGAFGRIWTQTCEVYAKPSRPNGRKETCCHFGGGLVRNSEGDASETRKLHGSICPAHHIRSLFINLLQSIFRFVSPPVLQVGKTFELLNCDQHKNIIVKSGRDPGQVRPDITHQVSISSIDRSHSESEKDVLLHYQK